MKMRKMVEPVLFGVMAVPIAYLAMSRALGGDLALSPANTRFALVLGVILGGLLGLVLVPFQLSNKPVVQKIGRIVDCVAEVTIFAGVYVWVTEVITI